MRNLGARYPHRGSCWKTGRRFEDDAVKSRRWRDKALCTSLDGPKSRCTGFPDDGLQTCCLDGALLQKLWLEPIPSDLAKNRSVHESSRS